MNAPVFAGMVLILLWLAVVIYNSVKAPPTRLGIVDGRLAPAPASPNCVLSQTSSEEHAMAPIEIPEGVPTTEVMSAVVAALSSEDRAKIVAHNDDYLHAEFISLVLRFVDDVEFYFDSEERLLHFRSASRAGYSDFGVNRSRMQKLVPAIESRLRDASAD